MVGIFDRSYFSSLLKNRHRVSSWSLRPPKCKILEDEQLRKDAGITPNSSLAGTTPKLAVAFPY